VRGKEILDLSNNDINPDEEVEEYDEEEYNEEEYNDEEENKDGQL
jgi:hypothetical protein